MMEPGTAPPKFSPVRHVHCLDCGTPVGVHDVWSPTQAQNDVPDDHECSIFAVIRHNGL